jgi:hypothetical protein
MPNKSIYIFLYLFGRIFCGKAAKNRALRGCAIAPAPALRAVAAAHPSNPLRKNRETRSTAFSLDSFNNRAILPQFRAKKPQN